MKLSVVVALVAAVCGVVICKSFAIPIYEASDEDVNGERPIERSKQYKPTCEGEGGTCTKQVEGAPNNEGVNEEKSRDSSKEYKPICEGEGGTCTKQVEGAPNNDQTDGGRISEGESIQDTAGSAGPRKGNSREAALKEIIHRLECRNTPDLCKSEYSYQGSAGPRERNPLEDILRREVHNRTCRTRPEMCKNESSSPGGTGSRKMNSREQTIQQIHDPPPCEYTNSAGACKKKPKSSQRDILDVDVRRIEDDDMPESAGPRKGKPRVKPFGDIIHHEDCRYPPELCELKPSTRGSAGQREEVSAREQPLLQNDHPSECRKRPEMCYSGSSFQGSAGARERNAREQELKEIIRRLECRYTPDLCKLDERRIADNDLAPVEPVYETRGGAGPRKGKPGIQAFGDIIHHEDCRYDTELCKLTPSPRGSAGARKGNLREQQALRQIHDRPDCEYTNSKEECELLSSPRGSAEVRERNAREQELKEIIRRLECRYTPDLCKSESSFQDIGDLQDQRRASSEFASDDWEPKLQERYFRGHDKDDPQIQGRAYDYYASDKWKPKLQERYFRGHDKDDPQVQGRAYNYYASDKWEPKLEERYFRGHDKDDPQVQGRAYNYYASDKWEPKLQERYFRGHDKDDPQVQGRDYDYDASDKWDPQLQERYFRGHDKDDPQVQRSAYNDFASDKWEPKLQERYFEKPDNNTPQFQRSAYNDFASDKWEPKLQGRYFRVPENEESPDTDLPQVKRDSINAGDSGVSQVEKSLSEVAELDVDKRHSEANRKIEYLRDASIDEMSSAELLAYLTELARDRRQQQT